MTWNCTYQPAFVADLKRLDLQVAQRILEKLEAIKDDPLRTMKRLKGSDLFSLRVGEYRIYARAYVAQRLLEFVRAGHRRNIHDR
ncbi:MAG: type II toxin-antitoxin system RelE/ParE family toxin [Candidatus Thermoplasmatota archaeon]